MSTDEPTPAPDDETAAPPEPTPASEDGPEPTPASEDETAAPVGESAADDEAMRAVSPTDADSEQAAEEGPAPETPAAEARAQAPETPAAEARAPAPETPAAAEAEEEYEPAPRQKPEIPGADLEPDVLPESDQYLDAEAQAAAEAEAEAAAERARAEAEDERSQPIADAAIDLAAGARYTATGKRKTSVARVILKPGAGEYSINGKALEVMFPRETLQRMIRQPLETVGYEARMDVVARMHGGGVSSQAGALRHGIARALIAADPNLRGELKRRGYLTRDPRVKERKKAGLKKARKRPQFSKR